MSAARCSKSLTGYPRVDITSPSSWSASVTAPPGPSTNRIWTLLHDATKRARPPVPDIGQVHRPARRPKDERPGDDQHGVGVREQVRSERTLGDGHVPRLLDEAPELADGHG